MRPRNVSIAEFCQMQAKVKGGVAPKVVERGYLIDGAGNRSLGYRSKLEAAWANYLRGLALLGAIEKFWYEPLNLRLPGKKNFYKPDFLVMSDRSLTFYEVKGRNKSDERSLVKLKTAAGLNPWAKFVLVKRIGGQWEEKVIG